MNDLDMQTTEEGIAALIAVTEPRPTTAQEAILAYREAKRWIEENPEPQSIELRTRILAEHTREEMRQRILHHLHWALANERASGITHQQEDNLDLYKPPYLELLAAPEGVPMTVEELHKDVTTLAIELLGLLWRLEDTGVIEPRESVVLP
jgi:hypothetical protein